MKRIATILPWLILLVYWPLLFVSTHIPRVPQMQIYGRDVTLHFTAYFILTLLYWMARYGKVRPGLAQGRFYAVIILIAVYGALDEITQGLVNRHCDFWDWVSDMSGCVGAMLVLYIMRRWRDWLIAYWLGLFVITHWPVKESAFVNLPLFLQQFQVMYYVMAYLILTLLWWRCLCNRGRYEVNRHILIWSLIIPCCYALLDEVVNKLMGRGFDVVDFLSALAGVGLGIACAMVFAQHHIADENL